MKDKVQIVILSRDRPKYLKETINSVLNQELLESRVEIVISDNSVRNEVEEMVSRDFSNENIKYIKRTPPLSAIKHFQLVISECSEKYLVLFHDDDVMHHDYIETMFPLIQQEGVAAVGCNAFLFNNNIKKAILGKTFSFTEPKTFASEKSFLSQYIPSSSGIAAFPGHMYNTEVLKKIDLNNVRRKGGVQDVLLLNSLLSFGVITWIPDFLMYYRLHDCNDGNSLYTVDHISLLNRMSHNGLDKNTVAAPMRFVYLSRWLLAQDVKNLFLWRNRIILKYLIFKSFFLVFRISSWRLFFNSNVIKKITLRGN